MLALWILITILLLISGFPVGFAILLGAMVYILQMGTVDPVIIATRAIIGVDSFIMLAIPLYIFAGAIMTHGGMAKRLMNFALVLVGHLKGGLAHMNIVASMIFAGMSGTASADAAGLGQIEIPMMVNSGYTKQTSAVVTAMSSTIGPIIPPSVPFVIYGALTGTSVGRLFLGGAIPGILMGLAMMFVVFLLARKYHYGVGKEKGPTFMEVLGALKESYLALLTPIIILGGIIGGIFTPTEAAVVAVFYGLFITVFVYRELPIRDIPKVIYDSMVISAVIMFIIAAASIFGWVMLVSGLTNGMLKIIYSLSSAPWVALLLVNILLLILGCFVEITALMIMLAPLFVPLISNFGLDPVHFGVMITLNLMIGLVTPPVGMAMYITCQLAKIKVVEFAKEGIPYYIILAVTLLIITYIPDIVTFLPNLLMGK